MPSNTAATNARELPFHAMPYLRMRVTYEDQNTVRPFLNQLPEGAQIAFTIVNIVEAFDGSASLDVGTNASSYDNIVDSTEIDETNAVSYHSFTGADLEFAADTQAYVKLAATNATQGEAIVVIVFVPDNDL